VAQELIKRAARAPGESEAEAAVPEAQA